MSSPNFPVFSDDLDVFLSQLLEALEIAVVDRKSAFHTPSLATVGLDGRPRNRTIVLRSFNATLRELSFYTDVRSDKYSELLRDPRVAVHFYDAGLKLQLRIEGEVTLHQRDVIAEHAWQSTWMTSRQVYATEPAPGCPISRADAFRVPDALTDSDAGRPNFVAVKIRCGRLEGLWLGSEGHRRAVFDWDRSGVEQRSRWLVP